VAELAIRTIDCGIVAMAALGYGGPWLWQAVTPMTVASLQSSPWWGKGAFLVLYLHSLYLL